MIMIRFEVTGAVPKPKGSMRSVGRGRMVEAVKGSKDWRQRVTLAAGQAMVGALADMFPAGTEVEVRLSFRFSRPTSVKNGRGPATSATGDLDKLCRNILDALTDAGVWHDDGQVVSLTASKTYTDGLAGVGVEVASFDRDRVMTP